MSFTYIFSVNWTQFLPCDCM